ncbi:MAG: hypothetical protein ACOC06_05895, partial [Halorubrum sp.]
MVRVASGSRVKTPGIPATRDDETDVATETAEAPVARLYVVAYKSLIDTNTTEAPVARLYVVAYKSLIDT